MFGLGYLKAGVWSLKVNISGLVGYLGILGLLSMKAALEVATIIATITKNVAIVECFPPLSPTISPRVTPSETSLRLFSYFALEASCFSQKESRRCCCPSDGRHLCLQALARPKTSSQLGADNSNQANLTLSTAAKIS